MLPLLGAALRLRAWVDGIEGRLPSLMFMLRVKLGSF